ncbi:hypothetical protein SKAU_G00098750 [Synaphobranchus kaupii]|uniref:Uncharacterized protein n=1 Tax=Synaphobranchus kaupii TaxID=118154 RepID=A0A9Q1FYQ2_SYNKA|nr:hypothetical protein SKAU_G00098750 [Synaphobranchus kaupii]
MGNQASHQIEVQPVDAKLQNGAPNGHVSVLSEDMGEVVACEADVQHNSELPSLPTKEASPPSGNEVDSGRNHTKGTPPVPESVVLLSFSNTVSPSTDAPEDPSQQPVSIKASVEEEASLQCPKPTLEKTTVFDSTPKEEEPNQKVEKKANFFDKIFKKKNKSEIEAEPTLVECNSPPEDQAPSVETQVVSNGLHSETGPLLGEQRVCVGDEADTPTEEAISLCSAPELKSAISDVPEDPAFCILAGADVSIEETASPKLEANPSRGEDTPSVPNALLQQIVDKELCAENTNGNSDDEKNGLSSDDPALRPEADLAYDVTLDSTASSVCVPQLVSSDTDLSETLPSITNTEILVASKEELNSSEEVSEHPSVDSLENYVFTVGDAVLSVQNDINPQASDQEADAQVVTTQLDSPVTEVPEVSSSELAKTKGFEDEMLGDDPHSTMMMEPESILIITNEEITDDQTAELPSAEVSSEEIILQVPEEETETLQMIEEQELSCSPEESEPVGTVELFDENRPKSEDEQNSLKVENNIVLPEFKMVFQEENENEAETGCTDDATQLPEEESNIILICTNLEPVKTEAFECSSLEPANNVETMLEAIAQFHKDIDLTEPICDSSPSEITVESDGLEGTETALCDSAEVCTEDTISGDNVETILSNEDEMLGDDPHSTMMMEPESILIITNEEITDDQTAELPSAEVSSEEIILQVPEEETETLQMIEEQELSCSPEASEPVGTVELFDENRPKSEDEQNSLKVENNIVLPEFKMVFQEENENEAETGCTDDATQLPEEESNIILICTNLEPVKTEAFECSSLEPANNVETMLEAIAQFHKDIDLTEPICDSSPSEITVESDGLEGTETALCDSAEVCTEDTISGDNVETILSNEDEMLGDDPHSTMMKVPESILIITNEEITDDPTAELSSTELSSEEIILQVPEEETETLQMIEKPELSGSGLPEASEPVGTVELVDENRPKSENEQNSLKVENNTVLPEVKMVFQEENENETNTGCTDYATQLPEDESNIILVCSRLEQVITEVSGCSSLEPADNVETTLEKIPQFDEDIDLTEPKCVSLPSEITMESYGFQDTETALCDGAEESISGDNVQTILSNEDEKLGNDPHSKLAEGPESILSITNADITEELTAKLPSVIVSSKEIVPQGPNNETETLQMIHKMELSVTGIPEESEPVGTVELVDENRPKSEDEQNSLKPESNAVLLEVKTVFQVETENEAETGSTDDATQLPEDEPKIMLACTSSEPVITEASVCLSLEPAVNVETKLEINPQFQERDIDLTEPTCDSLPSEITVASDSLEGTETALCNTAELCIEECISCPNVEMSLNNEDEMLCDDPHSTLTEGPESLLMITIEEIADDSTAELPSAEVSSEEIVPQVPEEVTETLQAIDELELSIPEVSEPESVLTITNEEIADDSTAELSSAEVYSEIISQGPDEETETLQMSASAVLEPPTGQVSSEEIICRVPEEEAETLQTDSEDVTFEADPKSDEEINICMSENSTELPEYDPMSSESTAQPDSTEDTHTTSDAGTEVSTEANFSSPKDDASPYTEEEMETNEMEPMQTVDDSESFLPVISEEKCETTFSEPVSTSIEDFIEDKIPKSEDELDCLEPEGHITLGNIEIPSSLPTEPSVNLDVPEDTEVETPLQSSVDVSAMEVTGFSGGEMSSSTGMVTENGHDDETTCCSEVKSDAQAVCTSIEPVNSETTESSSWEHTHSEEATLETKPKSDEEMDNCMPDNNQELSDGELSDSKLGSDSTEDTQSVLYIEAQLSTEDETPDKETRSTTEPEIKMGNKDDNLAQKKVETESTSKNTEVVPETSREEPAGVELPSEYHAALNNSTVSSANDEDINQNYVKPTVPEEEPQVIPMTTQSDTQETEIPEVSSPDPTMIEVFTEDKSHTSEDELVNSVSVSVPLRSDSGMESDSTEVSDHASAHQSAQDSTQGKAGFPEEELYPIITADEVVDMVLLLQQEVGVLDVALQL